MPDKHPREDPLLRIKPDGSAWIETEEQWEWFINHASAEELKRARDIVWRMTQEAATKQGRKLPIPPWER